MTAPKEIRDLVKRFDDNLDAYRSGEYNETQLRRYAWSAKLALSILSDFEELAVYDCRVKPTIDNPPHGRHRRRQRWNVRLPCSMVRLIHSSTNCTA